MGKVEGVFKFHGQYLGEGHCASFVYDDTEIPTYSSGDKVDIDWRREDFRFICCECENVHLIRFAVIGNRLRMRVWNENHSPRQPEREGGLRDAEWEDDYGPMWDLPPASERIENG